MDFALNDEQQMLQQSARRFFVDNHPLARARRALPWSDRAQQQLWNAMAEMGWMGLLLPEAQGGLGLGLTEASLLAEEAGRQLLNLPWASSAVLLPLWLCAAPVAAPAELREAVRDVLTGERALHCVAEGDVWWDYAGQCSGILVVRGWNDPSVPFQIALYPIAELAAVPALDPTLRQTPALKAALEWHFVPITAAAREHACAGHRLILTAELLGAAQAALDLACVYATERVQFGKPVGSYQAIKHQLANAWMALDNARLALHFALVALSDTLPNRRFACTAAEFVAIEGALQTTRTALQVHGGMGFTWEHDVHLYLKRVQHLAARLGGGAQALDRLEILALADEERIEGP